MKIYFFTNRKKVINAHSIIIDWLKAREYQVKFELSDKASQKIKVDNYDIVILEVGKNDRMIYKIVFDALMRNKPVLLLYEYHSRKPKDLVFSLEKQMLKYLTIRGYVISSLKEVLERFFVNLKKRPLERFNFFISKDIEEYLNWIPYSSAKTRSDFIRGLIRDKMEKDKKYGQYKTKTQKTPRLR